MRDWENKFYWAEYSNISVNPESDNYRLNISGYNRSSTAGDSLTNKEFSTWALHDQKGFTTVDRDNDMYSENCAETFKGGWWYDLCHAAKPTGVYINHTRYTKDPSDYKTWPVNIQAQDK